MTTAGKRDGRDGRTLISENGLLYVSIAIVGMSALSAVILVDMLTRSQTNAVLASFGFCSGVIGSGVSIWFALRTRRIAFVAVAVWSLLPLAFWILIFAEVFYGRLRM